MDKEMLLLLPESGMAIALLTELEEDEPLLLFTNVVFVDEGASRECCGIRLLPLADQVPLLELEPSLPSPSPLILSSPPLSSTEVASVVPLELIESWRLRESTLLRGLDGVYEYGDVRLIGDVRGDVAALGCCRGEGRGERVGELGVELELTDPEDVLRLN